MFANANGSEGDMGKLAIAALGGVLLALPGCPALAQAPNDGLIPARQKLTITVQEDGKVFIQATEVPWSELAQRLVAIGKSRGYSGDVFLHYDKSVDYGIVMRAMTEIKKADFNKILMEVPVPSPFRTRR